jgi:hypothetical protein
MSGQTISAAEATVKKLQSGIRQQMQAANDDAEQTFRSGKADSYFTTTNRDTAKSQFVAAWMRNEFPLTYAEVNSTPAYGIAVKSSFRRTIALAPSATADEQGSVCLVAALTAGRRGMNFKLEEAVGASSVQTVGTGASIVLDNWGTPIKLTRVNNDPTKPAVLSAGPDRTFGTTDDIRGDLLP